MAYPGPKDTMKTAKDPDFLQRIGAIEAPFSITENFMMISDILLLVTVWFKCIKRARATALFGRLCFAAELYLSLCSEPVGLEDKFQQTFSRQLPQAFHQRPRLTNHLSRAHLGPDDSIFCTTAKGIIRRSILESRPRSHGRGTENNKSSI